MTDGIHAKITADPSSFEQGMQRAQDSARRFQKSAQQTQASLGKTSSSFGLAKNSAQQFGFQIQDVAVQLGAGTNAGIVFAQQGSQIASIFGPGGAVIGAIIAVAGAVAGPFIASLAEAEDQVKDLTDELLELEKGFDDLTLAQRRFIQSVNLPKIAALERQIQTLTNEQESLLAILQTPIFSRTNEELKTQTDRYNEVGAAIDTAKQKLAELQKQQGILGGTVESDEAKKARERLEKEQEQQRQRQAKDRQRELDAIEQFENQKLNIRLALFSQADGLEAEAEAARHERNMDRLMEALTNELITIQEFNKLEEEEEQRHAKAMLDIRNGGLQGLERLVSQSYGKQAGMIAGSLKDTLGSLSKFSKEAFEVNKAASLADAIVKGYDAATAAWAQGMKAGGPPVAAAFAAASVAKTGAQIAAIQSQQFSGRSASGGSGGAVGGSGQPSAAVASPASENSIVNINLEGQSFGRDSVVGLIEQINEAVADGARINVA